jgi:hypothetical protein
VSDIYLNIFLSLALIVSRFYRDVIYRMKTGSKGVIRVCEGLGLGLLGN